MSESPVHSRGPWAFAYGVDKYGVVGGQVTAQNGGSILLVKSSVSDLLPEEVIANGYMAAAAPDLYFACRQALGAFEDGWAINWDDLRRAIESAEGKIAAKREDDKK